MWYAVAIVALASRGTDRLGDPLPPGVIARYGSTRLIHPCDDQRREFVYGWRLQFHPTRSEVDLLPQGAKGGGASGWKVPTGERVFRRENSDDPAKATVGVVFADGGRLRLELSGTHRATAFDDQSNRVLHVVPLDPKVEAKLLGVVGDRLAVWQPNGGRYEVSFRRLADGTTVGPTIPASYYRSWTAPAVFLSGDAKTLNDIDTGTHILRQYDTTTGRLLAWCNLPGADDPLLMKADGPRWFTQPSADGRRLFVTRHHAEPSQKGYPGYPVGKVHVFDLATRRVIAKHTHTLDEADADRLMHGRDVFPSGAFDEPTVSDDGRFVAWRGRSLRISLRHLESGRVVLTPTATDKKLIAFSPDGRRMATTCDGTIQLLDTATGQPIRTDGAPSMTHYTHELSPDGARVAVTSYDGSVWVYDAATAKPLWHSDAGPGFYPHAHFDAGGKFLLTEAGLAWLSNSDRSKNVLLDTRSGVAVRELPRWASGIFPDNRSILFDARIRGMERLSLEPLAWRVTPPPKPTAARLATLWARLAEPGAAGFDAVLELGLHPNDAGPFLRAKLAEPVSNSDRIEILIGQLGAKAFADREAATTALTGIGAEAAPHLRAAEKTVTAAEVRARVAKLLAVAGDPALPINLRRLRADEVLEKCRTK